MIDSVPDLKTEFERMKLLQSQGLAIMVSSGLKISKARKHSMRPLFQFTSAGILDSNPTSAHVLGTDDLASLSEKASKEQKALTGVFRPAYANRTKFRTSYFRYNRTYRGSNLSKNQVQSSYQDDKKYSKGRSKPRQTTTPTSK